MNLQSYLTETLGCNLVTYLGYGSLGFTGALVAEWEVIVTRLTNFTASPRHIRFTTENKIEPRHVEMSLKFWVVGMTLTVLVWKVVITWSNIGFCSIQWTYGPTLCLLIDNHICCNKGNISKVGYFWVLPLERIWVSINRQNVRPRDLVLFFFVISFLFFSFCFIYSFCSIKIFFLFLKAGVIPKEGWDLFAWCRQNIKKVIMISY